jgi:protein kinase A
MAAVVHKLFHHGHSSSNADADPASPPPAERKNSAMERALADEKRSLAHWEDRKRPLSPGQIDVDPEKKPVGHSSKLLDQDSFELVKTLGTGAHM